MFKYWLLCFSCAAFGLVTAERATAQTVYHPRWVGTWSAAPAHVDDPWGVRRFTNVTLREIVHTSVGGTRVRVRFTNAYGTDPLTISDAHIALSSTGAAIKPNSDRAITFFGDVSVIIPPGAEIFSDPVALSVPPLSNLAISFYLPYQAIRDETYHNEASQDNFIGNGDVSNAREFPIAIKVSSWYFLGGIDVEAMPGSGAVVALGDSITDGAGSSSNINRRWPDILASRFQASSGLKDTSVLNVGIGGNRVLNEGFGSSAISRFNRDVLAQDGVRVLIVLEGINDIGQLAGVQAPWDEVTAQELEFGLKQIAEAAHEHNIKIIGATLTPFGGAFYYSEKGEQIRESVNEWIRNSGTFDGIVDFDRTTRDPGNPKRFNPSYDSGDHLHPNDNGYMAMADAIDLTFFNR